jgi:membrane protein DedA with SNARE-associated domain
MESMVGWVVQYGYVAIFMLLMLGIVGLPVPDEMLLTLAGYLVFKHRLALVPTIGTALLGSICGVSLSYGFGRTLGLYLVQKIGRFLYLNREKLASARLWYERRGKYTLLCGYFVPGFRHLTACIAGSSQLPLTVFALFAYTGGLLWFSSFVALGYFLGEEWPRMSGRLHRSLAIGSGMAFISLAVLFVLVQRRRRSSRPLCGFPIKYLDRGM